MHRWNVSLLIMLAVLLSGALPAGSTPVSSPTVEQPTLFASSPDIVGRLPDAPDGEVAVVAQSGVLGDGNRVIAIVRNGTDRPVIGVSVSATVNDRLGAIAATAPPAPTAPVTIPPGGVGLVRLALDTPVADPASAAVDLTVSTEAPVPDRMDLAIPYAGVEKGELAGSLTAIEVDAAWDPELLIVCIGPDGALTDYAWAMLEPRRIDPYRSIPFRVALPTGCGTFLAAGTAHR